MTVFGQVVMVEVRVTGTVVTSVDVDCVPPADVEPRPEADVDTEAGGSGKGGITHPADPHAQYDDGLANVDE